MSEPNQEMTIACRALQGTCAFTAACIEFQYHSAPTTAHNAELVQCVHAHPGRPARQVQVLHALQHHPQLPHNIPTLQRHPHSCLIPCAGVCCSSSLSCCCHVPCRGCVPWLNFTLLTVKFLLESLQQGSQPHRLGEAARRKAQALVFKCLTC
jgi:hypothetical protein